MLKNDDDEKSLVEWGTELLTEMSHTAALMDEAHSSQRFTETIASQQAKLVDPSLTPSAQVLKVMTTENLNYGQFVMQQAKQHKNTLLADPMNPVMVDKLKAMQSRSLEEQRSIEASDTTDFDTYLADYMAS